MDTIKDMKDKKAKADAGPSFVEATRQIHRPHMRWDNMQKILSFIVCHKVLSRGLVTRFCHEVLSRGFVTRFSHEVLSRGFVTSQ